jgi:hypothetical protein
MSLHLDETDAALVYHRTKSNVKVYVCLHCIHSFTLKESFENHLSDCIMHKRKKFHSQKRIGISCSGNLTVKHNFALLLSMLISSHTCHL